jgi:hypothetical protein
VAALRKSRGVTGSLILIVMLMDLDREGLWRYGTDDTNERLT